MATQLTPRQKEIKDLIEQGNLPVDIAKQLKISPNAVYQQIRRMRDGGASVNAGRKSARTNRVAQPTAARPPAANNTAVPLTPQQALKSRQDEIQAELKASEQALADAQKVLDRAKSEHEKLSAHHGEELSRIEGARAALRGEKPKVARAPRKRSSNGKPKTQQAPPNAGTTPVAPASTPAAA